MTKGILVVLGLALLQGCATQFKPQASQGADDAVQHVSPLPMLRFQGATIVPDADTSPIGPADLRPGDILLTSASSLRSASIQLLTFAPVSHAAVYIGGGQVVEAVGSGVRLRSVRRLLDEEAIAVALRYPELSEEQAQSVRAVALDQVGRSFNFFGVAMHVPFTMNRRLCELPMLPEAVRDACLRGVGGLHHLVTSKRALFCSQLVLLSYRQAGVPLTDADPRLISPADILHMREGDVPSVKVRRPLQYVGYLKHEQVAAASPQN